MFANKSTQTCQDHDPKLLVSVVDAQQGNSKDFVIVAKGKYLPSKLLKNGNLGRL